MLRQCWGACVRNLRPDSANRNDHGRLAWLNSAAPAEAVSLQGSHEARDADSPTPYPVCTSLQLVIRLALSAVYCRMPVSKSRRHRAPLLQVPRPATARNDPVPEYLAQNGAHPICSL